MLLTIRRFSRSSSTTRILRPASGNGAEVGVDNIERHLGTDRAKRNRNLRLRRVGDEPRDGDTWLWNKLRITKSACVDIWLAGVVADACSLPPHLNLQNG